MLQYYCDEHIPAPIAQGLRSRGIDVLTAHEAGLADQGIPDTHQLVHATHLGRVLVTEDRDFITLAYSQTPHAGIILLQRPLSIGQYIEYLEFMSDMNELEDMRDQLVFCDW